ncbi:tail fiber domain-containing protein [Psychroserpens sp. AS72]|uniref:tail fiber domain-containing protein n=1 Tax=Psychroserpens sp. AS72 TaxID=3135775 RepID=UPI00317E590F
MKTRLTFLLVFLSGILLAQNGINYKAVIKDTNGNVIANSLVAVQFRILVTTDLLLAYEEIHTPTTDENGFITINIGEGTSSEEFPEFIWRAYDDHFLNVLIDTGGGFIDMGTTQFKQVPLAMYASRSGYASVALEVSNLKGLDRIIGDNGSGWRLAGRNPDYYGSVGSNAVDLSLSFTENINGGATGDYSFASGFDTLSSELASTAMGQFTIASGVVSTAIGAGAEATGDFSIAMGLNTQATEYASTALGHNTTSSGNFSTAFGNSTTAFGANSTALGYGTIALGSGSLAGGDDTSSIGRYSAAFGNETVAQSYISFVIGRYNTYGGNSDNWEDSNQLFAIGNGSSNTNRSNAMTVLKNGNTGIGTDNPLELLHINGGRLRIGTETIEDTGSNRLSFNADLLPDVNEGMQLGNSSFRWQGLWATDGTINTSDRRDKTNIKTIKYGLNEVLKMNPVSYNWKNRKNQDTKLGLIAQDLLELVPEVVKTHEWQNASDDENATLKKVELDRLGVYYSDLIPVLINAIKEQQKIIEDLNTKNSNLESKVEQNYQALLSRMEIIESKTSN